MSLLLERAIVLAESQPDFKYDPVKLEAIINAGVIPDGAVIAVKDDCNVIYKTTCLVMQDGNGNVVETVRLDDTLKHAAALVQYAVYASRLPKRLRT